MPSPLPVIVTNLPGTEWWPNLLQGLVGAVVGGVVGGMLALLAAVIVLRVTLTADKERAATEARERRELAAEERAADRDAPRAAIGVGAAARLLQLLAQLEPEWTHLSGSTEIGNRGYEAFLRFRAALLGDVPLLHVVQARTVLDDFGALVQSLRREFMVPEGMSRDAAIGARLEQFLAYEAHARNVLAAVVHSRTMPAYVRPPTLTSTELLAAWNPPDMPPTPH
jgi:hypothetical protein